MKFYRSIDQLPLFNYSKIVETNDLRFLLVLPDYFELPVIADKELQELSEAWEVINNEITDFARISDNQIKLTMKYTVGGTVKLQTLSGNFVYSLLPFVCTP